jgi:anti-anti-sigma factor
VSDAPVGHECHVITKAVGAVRILEVVGSFDWATVESFEDQMPDQVIDGAVVIDLSRTSRMDSAGTAAVLAAVAGCQQRGQPVVIVSEDPILAELLAAGGLGEAGPMVDSQAAALRWVGELG